MDGRPRPFIRMLVACLFFFVTTTLYLLLPRYWHDIPEIIKHLLLVLSAIMCMHIMEYTFLWWEIFGHMRNLMQETLHPTNLLINENKNSLEKFLHTTNQFIGKAAACGLIDIYNSRKGIEGDIYDSIKNAKKRLWLLDIAYSEIIPFEELIFSFNKKISEGIDGKILLLDAYHTQVVFRTFMESPPSEIYRIINTDQSKIPAFEPFFYQGVYSNFAHACDMLRNYPKVRDTARFYVHTPNCWLIIIDDTAYFQPYSSGKDPDRLWAAAGTGSHMPVFKFYMLSDSTPFKILEDHFLKLWMTSNIDLFHVEARIADHDRILKDIFNHHSWLFKQLYGILKLSKDKNNTIFDRRKFPRMSWKWDPLPSLHFFLEESKKTMTITGVCDYSREGISLQTDNTSGLGVGQIIRLQGTAPAAPYEANYVIDHFLKILRFTIVRITNELLPFIGVQAIFNGDGNEKNKPK